MGHTGEGIIAGGVTMGLVASFILVMSAGLWACPQEAGRITAP